MQSPRLSPSLLFLGAALVAAPAAASALQSPDSTPEGAERLAALAERLDAARVEAHVPGMSIAIVQGGEVVLARGFGLADVAAKRAADAATVYAIGSTTKAFTATMTGMAVDDGKLSWDDPVSQHLPTFQLAVRSDDPSAQCTLRDLLSHRHGFVRMSMLWMSGALSRSEVLERAALAEPLTEFRKSFHYSNVGYLAAGEAAAASMGKSWDALIENRILDPLGMSASVVSLKEARRSDALALGYRWSAEDGVTTQVPAVDLANIAPAGAIYSSAEDMARWVQFLLNRGQVDGTRLISAQSLEATWTPAISMGDADNHYGLGWMLHEYRGRRVVEHGGAVDGFTAQVTLMPDEGIGYVLLMNLEVSPLRESTIPVILNALLGPKEQEEQEEPPADVATSAAAQPVEPESCVGTYIANFAKFRDAKLSVAMVEDRLQLTIPGQGETLLSAPNDVGRRTLELTDQITVSFRGAPEGPAPAMIVHQGDFAFEVPREGTAQNSQVDPSTLEPYIGTYRRDLGGKLVKLLVANGELVMEDKGNWLAFAPVDAGGRAALRARSDQGATFTVNAEGTVESFVFRGKAGDRVFTRVVAGEDLPSRKELRTLRGTKQRVAARRAARGTKSTGTVRQPQSGLDGTYVSFASGRDSFASHLDFGVMGSMDEWTSGDAAWRHDPMRGTKAITGIELTQAQLGHPAAVSGDWRRHFDRVNVVRTDRREGRKAYVVQLEKKGLPNRSYWVDAETGDVVYIEQVFVAMGQKIPLQTTFSDFRDVAGIRTPHRVVHENPATGRTEITIESIEHGLKLEDDVFTTEVALGQQSAAVGAPK